MKKNYNIHVHFKIVAFIGDQPEQGLINYSMLGNSKFGSRYLFSVDIEAIANYLPMCESCLNKARHNKQYIAKKTNVIFVYNGI